MGESMIKATYDNIIVKLNETHKVENIIIPDNVKNTMRTVEAEVVSVGPDYPYEVKEGDKILIQQYTSGQTEGIELVIDDVKYMSVASKWVMGVVE